MIRKIEFNMSMFELDLLVQFSILFEIVVVLLFICYLKLKYGIFKHIFPTQTPATPSTISEELEINTFRPLQACFFSFLNVMMVHPIGVN